MKRQIYSIVIAVLIAFAVLGTGETSWGADEPPLKGAPIPTQKTQATNLLVNGSMEEGFYWKYPNHYVANGWKRWWIHGTVLPEYDDTRTYRPHFDGKHAQAYFKWGDTYTAGIYQVVSGLTPCTPYQLAVWSRNHSLEGALPHARIGLDPEGQDFAPNGAVKTGLPPATVWSWEQTSLFTWEELSVETEPVGDRLTAILYAAPRPGDNRTHYYDTLWDAASLTAASFPNNRLPEPALWEPSGFITNVVTRVGAGILVVEWDTLEPASTQVWYDIITPTVPITPTGTLLISCTVYLPVVISQPSIDREYDFATPLDTSPTTHHRAVVSPLKAGEKAKFVILSRRRIDTACTTEMYGAITSPGMPPLLYVYLPLTTK
jgi:hypothetical protein